METENKNDYDRIAEDINRALAVFIGSSHEPFSGSGDSISITKDGFITGVIRLQWLQNWVEGLAESHRS